MLNALGVKTCIDMWDQRLMLYQLFSSISSDYFLRVSLGIQALEINDNTEACQKSIRYLEDVFGEDRLVTIFTKVNSIHSHPQVILRF